MANESPDFEDAPRKRIKLYYDDPACNSDSAMNSSDSFANEDEKDFNGGELSGYDSDGNGNVDSLSENSGSDDENGLDDTSSTVNGEDSDSSSQSDTEHSNKSYIAGGSSTIYTRWLERQMLEGVCPRSLIYKINGDTSEIPSSISDMLIWRALFQCISNEHIRNKLPHVYSFNHAVNLIRGASKILVVTGAGVSVSCGIPDFRSKDGIYKRLAVDFPNLPDPQAMFDINYFKQDPRPFFKFAKEIFPGKFQPSPSHRFIKMLEKQNKLLRNYTQNIDTLERVAGIDNVIECHGSFATATCTVCNYRVPSEEIKEAVFNQVIPYCTRCPSDVSDESQRGIMKPDIVFFGEGLPDSFHDMAPKDTKDCDLLIVIGSSMKVRPVALIPSDVPSNIPQILINRESLPVMLNFDVELLGDADVIVDEICRRLGGDWEEVCWRETPLKHLKKVYTGRKYKKSLPVSDASCSSSLYSSENEKESSTVTEVRCQAIGKRHIGTDDDNSRHVSLDSSRDSGIGENSSNSCDSNLLTSSVPLSSATSEPTGDAILPPSTTATSAPSPEMTDTEFSAPVRRLTIKLTEEEKLNSFYRLSRRKFVFPGAELPEFSDSDEETQ